MAILPKPDRFIDWVPDGDPGKVTEPSNPKKDLGFLPDERPSPFHHNWLFFKLDQWQKYFESVTDEFLATLGLFDAVVGSGGLATHATIQEAHDDGGIGPGSTILVIESLVFAAPQLITKAGIEILCKPNVTLSKGSGGTGLDIGASANGFRMRFGRMSGWGGGGEKAFNIDAAADFVILRDIRFAGNTKDVEDNGNSTLSTSGFVTE